MSRKPLRPRNFFTGSIDKEYGGPWLIDSRRVSRGEFKRSYQSVFGQQLHRGAPITRASGARGRKSALLASRPLVGCDHEFSYHEDTIGDHGVIGGTYIERWLQCDHCGAREPASWEDAPSYDDYY